MEMFGAAIVLLGLLALILSSVILIISIIKNQKSKLVSGLILLTSIILMALGAGIMSLDSPKQRVKEEPPVEDALADDTNGDVDPVEDIVKETPDNEDEREYYLNEVAPLVEKTTKTFDENWQTLWKEPFERASRGESSESEIKQNLEKLNDVYVELRDELESFEPTNLSDENKQNFEEYKTRVEALLTSRIFVTDNIIKAIETNTLTENVINNSVSIVDISDEDTVGAAVSITKIKENLNLLD